MCGDLSFANQLLNGKIGYLCRGTRQGRESDRTIRCAQVYSNSELCFGHEELCARSTRTVRACEVTMRIDAPALADFQKFIAQRPMVCFRFALVFRMSALEIHASFVVTNRGQLI